MRCAVDDAECVSGRLRQGLCERHYRRWRKHGDTSSRRFDNLHAFIVADGCWIWTGPKWPNGYGKTTIPVHGTTLAHRAIYIEHKGPIAVGYDLDHHCHNADPTCERGPICRHRACVNPEHLRPVQHVTNLVNAIITRPTCEAGLHDLTGPDAVLGDTHQCVGCWRTRYRSAGARYRARKRAERQRE